MGNHLIKLWVLTLLEVSCLGFKNSGSPMILVVNEQGHLGVRVHFLLQAEAVAEVDLEHPLPPLLPQFLLDVRNARALCLEGLLVVRYNGLQVNL